LDSAWRGGLCSLTEQAGIAATLGLATLAVASGALAWRGRAHNVKEWWLSRLVSHGFRDGQVLRQPTQSSRLILIRRKVLSSATL